MEEEKKLEVNKKKVIVYQSVQGILSLILIFVILYGGYYYGPALPVPKTNGFSEKMMYTLRFAGFPSALVLFVSINMVANKRGSTPASNPLAGNEKYVQLEKNVLMNTVEQFLVFNFFNLVLVTMLQPPEMRIIPIYTLLFVIGRILFRVGYGIDPMFRGLGILTQFFANYLIVGVILYLMYTRGIMYNIPTALSFVNTPKEEKSEL